MMFAVLWCFGALSCPVLLFSAFFSVIVTCHQTIPSFACIPASLFTTFMLKLYIFFNGLYVSSPVS